METGYSKNAFLFSLQSNIGKKIMKKMYVYTSVHTHMCSLLKITFKVVDYGSFKFLFFKLLLFFQLKKVLDVER